MISWSVSADISQLFRRKKTVDVHTCVRNATTHRSISAGTSRMHGNHGIAG